MPESTTNIFSMAPPVSVKNSDSVGEKSTFSGDSTSKNSSSFSSKLSDAEERQRSGFRDGDTTDKRVSARAKPVKNSEADDPIKDSGSKKNVGTDDSLDTTGKSSEVNRFVSGETVISGVDHPRAEPAQELLQEALPVKSDGPQIEALTQTNSALSLDGSAEESTEDLGLLGSSINDIKIEKPVANEATIVRNLIDNVREPIVDATNPVKTGLPVSEDLTAVNTTSLKEAVTLENPLVLPGAAIGTTTAESGKTAVASSTDAALLSTNKSAATSTATLTDVLSKPLTDLNGKENLLPTVKTPQSTVPLAANEAEKVATLPVIDTRLGRLSTTGESFEISRSEPAIILGDTRNSKNVDASVMNLRTQAPVLDGEQIIKQPNLPSVSIPTMTKGEQQKELLISELALPKEASLGARLPQSAAVGVSPDLRSAQPTVQIETLTAAPIAMNSELAKGVSGATALDHMLTAATSGIVTAPTQGRVDLANTPMVNTPLNAPLNVPLLASGASEALTGNIRWMVGEGIQNATINVTPSGMGPITVQIGVEKDQMSISIIATQGSTREALEAAIPRLRDSLGTQGLESIKVDISDGRSDQSKSNTNGERQAFGGNTENNTNKDGAGSFSNTNEQNSGERVLSDVERDLLSQLQDLSTDPSISQSSIRHGYDLYV